MKKLLLCMVFILLFCRSGIADTPEEILRAHYKELNLKEEWQGCATDSECTAAIVSCYEWYPINKQHMEELVKSQNWISCQNSADPGPQPVVACVNNACKETASRTNMTLNDWLNEYPRFQGKWAE